MRKITKSIEKHPYIWLYVFILLSGIVIYSHFIFGDYIFAYRDWGSDTKESYLPLYEYYTQKITDFRLGDYDFSYGLGTSIFANISFAADPFGLIIILIGSMLGAEKIGYIIIYVQLLKSVLLGTIGMYYLKMFNISNCARIISSYVLAFCGYVMITGQHYQFASYAVLYMLTVMLCEKTLRNKKWWFGVVVSVALQGIVSPYLVFQSLIGLGIYCLIRVFQLYHKTEVKDAIQSFGSLIGAMILGLLISMFSFLPQCYEILVISKRVSGDESVFSLLKRMFSILPKEFIVTGFMRLFSNNLQGLINSYETPVTFFQASPFYFSLFFPLCITQQIAKVFEKERLIKERLIRLIIILLMAFIFFFSFFPLLSNLFAYTAHRFVFVLLPVFVLCMAETLNDLFIKKRYNTGICLVTTLISAFLLVVLFESKSPYSFLCIKETILLLIVIAIISILVKYEKKNAIDRFLKLLLACCIALSIFVDSWISLYTERVIVTKDEYENTYHMPYFYEFEQIIDEEDNFIRVDRTFLGYDGSPDMMFSYIHPIRSMSIYNSTLSKHTIEYIEKIVGKEVVTQAAYSIGSYGVWYDIHMADLMGLKYIIGYPNNEHDGWDIVAEHNGYYLYKNQVLESAGLMYDGYVTEDEYEKMSKEEQASVTSQAVILDEDVIEIDKKKSMDYYELKDAVKSVSKEEKNVVITIEPLESEEKKYFLSFNGKGIETAVVQNEYQEILDTRTIGSDKKMTNIIIPITSEVSQVTLTGKQIEINMQDLKVYATDLQYDRGIETSNPKMGNVVECNVTVDDARILYMPIGYDKNWHVYVNGEEKELLKVNYGFVGVLLEPGNNEVQFVYRNKYFHIGIAVSVASIFFAMLCVINKKVIRKNEKHK